MSPAVIGVDLGGTKVAAARLHDAVLSDSVIEPTQLSSNQALIEQLVGLVEQVRQSELDAVGIGVPSVVEFATGRVVSSVNIPLADVPLRHVLGDRIGVPVYVDNDATVAALAEAHDGELRPVARNLVMLTVGTGVGGGIVLDGRIYRGSTGGAGELGQTIIGGDLTDSVPPPSQFPQPGSLEQLAAGHALDVLGTQLAAAHPESELARRAGPDGRCPGPDVVAAARDGDPVAASAVDLWARRLGIGIANAINTFDPDEVVIGGGGILAGELLLGPATEVARGYVNPGLGARTSIRLARHGVRAGVLGAALLAAHEIEDAQRAPAAGAGAQHADGA
ncbi:MAG TPA: ROK family protein [Solirubrobacteraceae bacterium]|nr:ROK family protein [Solirubrobacteraceae bacterium]